MNLDHFGMDTITLAGPLEAKLRAIQAAGFTQVMLNATDIVGHPGGEPAAIDAVRASGLRVTGFQVLRDFEGLSGHLHAYKVDIAKAMLEMCHALGSRVLLVCSSTSAHATGDPDVLTQGPAEARDARGAARHPHRLRGAVLGPARQRVPAGLGHRGRRPTAPTSASRSTRSTSSPPAPTSSALEEIDRARRSSWCSSPTSCGRRSARARSASTPRATSACSPARACTATQVAELVRTLDAHRLPRRLQLRGVQRRLHASCRSPIVARARPALGEMAHRPGVAAQPAAARGRALNHAITSPLRRAHRRAHALPARGRAVPPRG